MHETADSTRTGYARTQTAPLCLISHALALACFALAWIFGDMPAIYVCGRAYPLIARGRRSNP